MDEEESLLYFDDEEAFSDEEDGVSSTELELSSSESAGFEDEGESSPQAASAMARAELKINDFFMKTFLCFLPFPIN